MMKVIIVVMLSVSAAFLTGAQVSSADVRGCTAQEAKEVEGIAAKIKSWGRLYHVFERYGHCDDGGIGEGFSESVSLLLAMQWENVTELGEIVASKPQFLHFVIRHIDETVPTDRLGKIIENANTKCPSNMQIICGDVKRTASMSAAGS
jgi:hypothetical protein